MGGDKLKLLGVEALAYPIEIICVRLNRHYTLKTSEFVAAKKPAVVVWTKLITY